MITKEIKISLILLSLTFSAHLAAAQDYYPPQYPGYPAITSVITGSATYITSGSAILNATFQTGSTPTTVWFEYGNSPSLGQATTPRIFNGYQPDGNLANGIQNLTPGQTYYFRVVAENSFGRSEGASASFETTGDPGLTGRQGSRTAKTALASGHSSGNIRPSSGSQFDILEAMTRLGSSANYYLILIGVLIFLMFLGSRLA